MAPLLEITDLRVRFEDDVDALRGVNLSLDRGESLAIVGESGAGKSTLAQCTVGLVQPPQASGSVRLDGQELVGASDATLREVRWRKVAIGLQGAPFNPVATVGAQIAEPLHERAGMDRRAARARADALAREVLLDPLTLERFPHQLSGGQRRRAMIAMALALDPDLVVLDEPTAGLDPLTKQELLERLGQLARERGFALIVISHDLPAAVELAQRTVVLYAGEVMEDGASEAVIEDPSHPYTWALVRAYPLMTTTKDLHPIRGRSPGPRAVPGGCPFHPRCTQAEAICAEQHPGLEPSRGRLVTCHFGGVLDLLTADGVGMTYRSGKQRIAALADVSLVVRHGEAVGIIGASGSGKTTLARIISGHLNPDQGAVSLGGQRLASSWRQEQRTFQRTIQLVMQDPWDALSPRLSVQEIVREPLDIEGSAARAQADARVAEMLEAVGLPSSAEFLREHTHNLSGGELQRISLARALIARPKLLVADEPTSMLDASEQARLLVILRELQVEMGLGLVLVSHDVAVVRKVTDRTVVLDGGRLAEQGPSELVCTRPRSAAARRLVAAAGMGASVGTNEEPPRTREKEESAWTRA
ncbi:MAG TPA: ABC transporter ATP-binding protein [Solirubrobacteraceae bacterium]|jgi:peptide/nickel transport system ATP-binding protein|nr:ABC transporter ATP-binding protein [Solirubrobacteraceae bacterium]